MKRTSLLKLGLSIILIGIQLNAFAQAEPLPDPVQSHQNKNHCNWPVAGAQFQNFSIVHLSTIGSTPSISLHTDTIRKKPSNYSHLNGQYIRTKKDYQQLTGDSKLSLNWNKYKLYIVSTTNTYKHGALEYSNNLMGFCTSSDNKTLYMGYKNIFHGVCQGIAQLSEWFSYETSTYYVILPIATPENIQTIYCHSGPDCSNIP